MRDARRIAGIWSYVLYLVAIVVIFDTVVLRMWLGYGYPTHYQEENVKRYPAPYTMFTGKPNARNHNALGFQGKTLEEAGPDRLKIAFFGGSTGYAGHPPIAPVVEKRLSDLLNADVFVANYSVVSSNHRQHLHGMLEYLPDHKPDIVVFYGGYNETLQSAYYDPRPGYPYNYFYRAETGPIVKLMMRYSAILGEIDKEYGIFTGIDRLRREQMPLSPEWNGRIVRKYFQTLDLAHRLAGSLDSAHCGKTKFVAFYQPYQVPDRFREAHETIKRRLGDLAYVFDVSSAYDGLDESPFTDIVHVNQQARELMGSKIAKVIYQEIKSGLLSGCSGRT